jgi:hypothetical protein
MIRDGLLAQLTKTITQRLWLLVVPLAMLNTGCAGLISSTSKPSAGGATPLTVSITSPASGATVSGTITVSANASDNIGITGVQFLIDGSNLGAPATTAPYSASLNTTTLANGKHTLTAIATGASNNKATSAAVSIIANNAQANQPTVSITSPASGATVSGTITVSASASSHVGIASVQFLVDGSKLGAADTTAPYSASLNTTTLANGNHALTAVVTDTSNNKATSAAVSIIANNAQANLPAVSITSPLAGIVVSGTISVTATASDSAGIAIVQFQVDGSNLGAADTTPPYSQSWNTTTVADGPHTLKAVATSSDSSQKQGSASVVVTVNNSGSGPGLSSTPGWHKIPGTALCGGPENATFTVSDDFPADLGPYTSYSFPFVENCYQALEDSNSAVMDTARHRLIIWGGGHEHYWGNDVWSLELNNVGSSSPVMVHLDYPANPSEIVGSTSTVETLAACSYAPGCTPTAQTPGSRHTYDGIVYIPGQDEMASFAGATSPNGNGTENVWLLGMGSVLASCAPNCNPNWTDLGAIMSSGSVGTVSGYDPNTQGVWVATQNDLFFFDPATNALSTKATMSLGYHSVGVVDPVDNYFIIIGPQNASPEEGILYFDISSTSTFTLNRPTTTNCGPVTSGAFANGEWPQYQGLAWDPVSQQVVIYPNGTNTLYLLNPKTWTCTSETYGSTQGVDYPQDTVINNLGSNGTWKHFNYDPGLDVFVVCNDPYNDCWYLRPKR